MLLDKSAAVKYFDGTISERELLRLARERVIASYKLGHKKVCFETSDLEEYKNRQRRAVNPLMVEGG